MSFPKRVQAELGRIERDPLLNVGVKEMLGRRGSSLAGVGVWEPSRIAFDKALSYAWTTELPNTVVSEVVIGAGAHAAAYCAARVHYGHPGPVVLEAADDVGGVFAQPGPRPAFYLNSRNRAGRLGTPGSGVGLNVLPFAPLQPAELSMSEFQPNTDLAFVIRTALAAHTARVVTGAKVKFAERDGRVWRLALTDGRVLLARRIVDARGLGNEKRIRKFDYGDRLLTAGQFMRRMATVNFPLANLDRVAVVGGGDSGKCTIEALVGQGPGGHMSTAALDRIDKIDWYATNLPGIDCESWTSFARGRYRRLASMLPGAAGRVQPFKRGRIASTFDGYTVNGKSYDLVICAIGYQPPKALLPESADRTVRDQDQTIARKPASRYYTIGPVADLPFENDEDPAIPENRTALFRLIGRTARLARRLP